jgi:hypothetical protein
VKDRLDLHPSKNSLFNKCQSAYSRFHSTETTLLALHDHLTQAISVQKLSGLCLLDLSAAFDTIDHPILLHRLSTWFGIKGPALAWFQSYLSSRFFTVSCAGHTSPESPQTFGVPQGSVLGPVLFTLYTTPLSDLISSTSTDHHLYADGTQLFISFNLMTSLHMLTLSEELSPMSLPGCHPIFSLSTLTRQNFYFSETRSNY